MKTNKLSVTIITKNEEKNIERCLKSLTWADEIIILDSGSTDKTLAICQQYQCKIIKSEWLGFGDTKQLAVNHAAYDWIFSIDADEEVSDDLKHDILSILSDPLYYGYRIKINSFYLNRMINYCGWNHEYTIRLFDKRYGKFNNKIVHEFVQVKGEIGNIESNLFHYTYPSLTSHFNKMNLYTSLGAGESISKGKSSSIIKAHLRGILKFIKMYFIQRGFLDGKIGFLLSFNSAIGVYLKYLKIWEIKRIDEE